jgi:TPR repeat protein
MYEQGKGLRKDPERAYYHYTLASLGQNRKGEAEARKLASSLPPAAVERASGRWRSGAGGTDAVRRPARSGEAQGHDPDRRGSAREPGRAGINLGPGGAAPDPDQ